MPSSRLPQDALLLAPLRPRGAKRRRHQRFQLCFVPPLRPSACLGPVRGADGAEGETFSVPKRKRKDKGVKASLKNSQYYDFNR